jgi:hypothetical protein
MTLGFKIARERQEWLASIRSIYPWLRCVFAEGGYAGLKLRRALSRIGAWNLTIITRSDLEKDFELLLRRCVVERIFA